MKTTAHANLYYKFGESGLYSKLSWGQYLAGDEGGTLKVWKRFKNGAEMGAYATFTDVSFEEYGEGLSIKVYFLKYPSIYLAEKVSILMVKAFNKDPVPMKNLRAL